MPTDLKRIYCKKCGKQFSKQLGTNRLNCYDCKPERTQNSAKISHFRLQNGQNSAENGENPQENEEGRLTKSSREKLEEWGVLGTWQADAVLTLAIAIDSGKGGGSAGIAGAIKAHREAMAVAHEVADVEEVDNVTSIFQDLG